MADGLLGVESVKRHRILVTDSIGRVWFALSRGLSVADPARADDRGQPAITLVEQMTADGAQVDVHGPIRIPSSRRRLAVTYAGLSLSVPERVRYRYRLDGFDSDWSDPVAERQAVYTNLAPGHYRFRVIASNSDGVWNGTEATMPFEVRAMFWQTSWFQLSAVVFVRTGRMGPLPTPRPSGREAAQRPFRGAACRANTHRAGIARYAAAGLRQRIDAAARRRRSAAGGFSSEAIASSGAGSDGESH